VCNWDKCAEIAALLEEHDSAYSGFVTVRKTAPKPMRVALYASIDWHLRPTNKEVYEYCVGKHHWLRQLAIDNSGTGNLANGKGRYFTTPISSTDTRRYYTNLEDCNKSEKCLACGSRTTAVVFSDTDMSKAKGMYGMYVQAPCGFSKKW